VLQHTGDLKALAAVPPQTANYSSRNPNFFPISPDKTPLHRADAQIEGAVSQHQKALNASVSSLELLPASRRLRAHSIP